MERSNLLIHNITRIWLIMIIWLWLFQGLFQTKQILVLVRESIPYNIDLFALKFCNKWSAWDFNAYVAPIKIVNPSDVELPNFTDCQTSGYGYTQE